MNTANTAQAAGAAAHITYAGFWVRLAAQLVDWVILGVIGYIFFGQDVTSMSEGSVSVNYEGWRMIVPLLYTLIFWVWRGATPGKMILKLKVENEDGSAMDWKKAVLRMVAYLASALPLFIGFIWIGIDGKKQGWHDKIAKTLVVKNG